MTEESVWDEILQQFFSSARSDKVKKSAKIILEYLNNRLVTDLSKPNINEEDAGWIRAKDLYAALVETKEIPYPTQFFRILESLVNIEILEKDENRPVKRGKGSKPVYYRIKSMISPTVWMDRDHLISELQYQGRIINYLLARSFILDKIREKKIPDDHELFSLLEIEKIISYDYIEESTSNFDLINEKFRPLPSDYIIDFRIIEDQKTTEHLTQIRQYYHRIKHSFAYPHPPINLDKYEIIVDRENGIVKVKERVE